MSGSGREPPGPPCPHRRAGPGKAAGRRARRRRPGLAAARTWARARAQARAARRVGLSIPTTSQHLAKLRLAGIVSARREGRHTYYTVEDPHVLTMLEQIFGHIAPDGTLAPDP
jgi:DNA-binding transcriptional ArsR family regulator